MVARFERLCAFLERQRDRFPTVGLREPLALAAAAGDPEVPKVSLPPTIIRHYEQLRRRLANRVAALVPGGGHS